MNDNFSLEKIQKVNWQYFLTEVIKLVDKPKKKIIFGERSLYIFENIFHQIIKSKEEHVLFSISKLQRALRDI